MITQVWTYNMASALIGLGVHPGTAWRCARNQVRLKRHGYYTNHGAYALVLSRQLLNDGEPLDRVPGSLADQAMDRLQEIAESQKSDVVRPEDGL